MGPQIYAKSMKSRGGVRKQFWERFGSQKDKGESDYSRFGRQFWIKSRKMVSKKASQNRCRKSVGNRCRKGRNIEPKWYPKSMMFWIFRKRQKCWKHSKYILILKNWGPISMKKSTGNRCKIEAGKSYANVWKIYPKLIQNESRNRSRIQQMLKKGFWKLMQKISAKKRWSKNISKSKSGSTLGRPWVDLSCLRQYNRSGPRKVGVHAKLRV